MEKLDTVQQIGFFADEFINSSNHLREGLSANELLDLKSDLMYFMVKAVKSEILGLGIKPPNKITVTQSDITERIHELVDFEKANEFQPLNDRASKDLRKAVNGTYKTWLK